MEYTILGKKFEISQEVKNYSIIRSKYLEWANEIRDTFIKEYDSAINSMDGFMNKIDSLLLGKIQEAADLSVSYLNKNKIYTVDSELFLKKYFNAVDAEKINTIRTLEEIKEKYYEIVATKEEMEEYRRERKENRGRVVGGGFGIDGAITGMVTAGAMNMATGLLHSAFNAVGNIAGSIQASLEKKELFNSGIESQLANALRDDVYVMRLTCMNIMHSEKDISFYRLNTTQMDKVNALINNLENGFIPEDDEPDVVNQILNINPFCIPVYEYCLKNYGDDGQLGQLGEELIKDFNLVKTHVLLEMLEEDGDIAVLKELENVKGLEEANQKKQAAFELRDKITNNAEFIALPQEYYEQFLTPVNNVILTLRTVEGVVFDTVEEAEDVRKDIEIYEKFLKDNEDKDGLIEKFHALPFKTGFVKDTKLEEVSVKSRTVKGIVFDTDEEAHFAREDLKLYDNYRSGHITDDDLGEQLLSLPYKTRIIKDTKQVQINEILCTVKEVKFTTQEEAALAREDIKLFDAYLEDHVDEKVIIQNVLNLPYKTKIIADSNYPYKKLYDRVGFYDKVAFLCETYRMRIVSQIENHVMTPELISSLGIENGTYVYWICDDTKNRNGKYGVAITEKGIHSCGKKVPLMFLSYEELGRTKSLICTDDYSYGLEIKIDGNTVIQSKTILYNNAYIFKKLIKSIYELSRDEYEKIKGNRESTPVDELKEKIRDLCVEYEVKWGGTKKYADRLRNGLEINENERIFTANDYAIFKKSGKYGFAITENGIYCRMPDEEVRFFSWKYLSGDIDINWSDKNHFHIMINGKMAICGIYDEEMQDSAFSLLKKICETCREYANQIPDEIVAGPVVPILSDASFHEEVEVTKKGNDNQEPAFATNKNDRVTETNIDVSVNNNKNEIPGGFIEQIKKLCEFHISRFGDGNYKATPVLLNGLNVDADAKVYLAHDDTIKKNGKNGFAITDKGIFCRQIFGKPVFTSYDALARADKITYDRGKTGTYAGEVPLTLFTDAKSERSAIVELIEAIHKNCRNGDAKNSGNYGAVEEKGNEIIFCPNCGQKIYPDSIFCIFCGNKIPF